MELGSKVYKTFGCLKSGFTKMRKTTTLEQREGFFYDNTHRLEVATKIQRASLELFRMQRLLKMTTDLVIKELLGLFSLSEKAFLKIII